MNYPSEQSISAIMMIYIAGLMTGLLLSGFNIDSITLVGWIMILPLVIFCLVALILMLYYASYEGIYKPLKYYEQNFGSTGLGDEYINKQREQHDKKIEKKLMKNYYSD